MKTRRTVKRTIVLPDDTDTATLHTMLRTLAAKYESECKLAAELEREIEQKTAILEAVAHDLRAPATAILGSVLTLQRDAGRLENEDRSRLLGAIAAGAHKLNRLLGDLLDLDRIEHGIPTSMRTETNVEEVVHRVVDEMRENHHIVITADIPRIRAKIDGAKLERMIENLLTNAVRHTPVGTRVWISATVGDDGVVIAVEDEGPGVSKERKNVVFEPFMHGGHPESTGIGLTIVRRFAEAQGGRAWVEDRPGGGASFKVFLPS